jgi:hypothetical protein
MIPAEYRDEPLEVLDMVAGLLWYAIRGLVLFALVYGGAILWLAL